MPDRPVALFALGPGYAGGVFPVDVVDRLRRVVRIPSAAPLESFQDPVAVTLLAEVEVLLTGWGCPRVDEYALAAAPRLRAIVHAAGSVKAYLDPVVFARDITVSTAAAANAVPVADYTIAALSLGAKRAFARARGYAAGLDRSVWQPGEGTGLYRCTVGVVGASRIGRLVLDRLRAFEVRVLLADPYLDPAQARLLGAELVGVDELCRHADLVTLHAPALPETRHLLDRRRLALLPDGALVVNTARGSLVDTAALAEQCASGRVSAVLDVTEPEPLPPGHPLLTLPNVLVTPHIAGAQGRELRRLGEYAAAEVERLVRGEPLHGLVRAADLSRLA